MASKLHFLIYSSNAAQNQQHGDKLKICNVHTIFTVWGRPAIPGVRHSGGLPVIPGGRHSGRQPFGDELDSCARIPRSASAGPGIREYCGPRVSRSLSIVGWLQKKGGEG